MFEMGGFLVKLIGVQLICIVSCLIWTSVTAFILFKLISVIIGIRVSAQDEAEGLDFTKHSGSAYPDFVISSYAKK